MNRIDLEKKLGRDFFVRAKHFFKSPLPGISLFSSPEDKDPSLLNSLVEYEKSELIDKDLSCGLSSYKHYRLFLHSSGVVINVVAKSLKVTD
jgi:hypothetical protein